MSISSTGLYGSATIVNSDLFNDVEDLKDQVTTLSTSYLDTTREHREDISQNKYVIRQLLRLPRSCMRVAKGTRLVELTKSNSLLRLPGAACLPKGTRLVELTKLNSLLRLPRSCMRVAKGTRLVELTELTRSNSLLRLPRSCMRVAKGTKLRCIYFNASRALCDASLRNRWSGLAPAGSRH
jgi:hypothetical protein